MSTEQKETETMNRLERLMEFINKSDISASYKIQLVEMLTDIQVDIPNEFPYYFDK